MDEKAEMDADDDDEDDDADDAEDDADNDAEVEEEDAVASMHGVDGTGDLLPPRFAFWFWCRSCWYAEHIA